MGHPLFLQGSDIVYDTFLRPMVMQYEPNIEQRLLHLRARSGHLLTFYMKNFADKGTTFFMDVLRYVVSDGPGASISEVTTYLFSLPTFHRHINSKSFISR
jgi:receptor expression-enhancing protein 1/2/3/4